MAKKSKKDASTVTAPFVEWASKAADVPTQSSLKKSLTAANPKTQKANVESNRKQFKGGTSSKRRWGSKK